MLILYNTLQLLLLLLFFPLLIFYVTIKDKYRNRILGRLGYNLAQRLASVSRGKKTIWVHALSVGEVTSVAPLVVMMRRNFPDKNIIFSASTKTGFVLAEKKLHQHCDAIIPFPLDILPVVNYFIKLIQPCLFILVETDFWPNLLLQLKKRNIPLILVNGRISKKSMYQYQKYAFFFRPMFLAFSFCCVQTDTDQNRFRQFGIAADSIRKLGNLKFEPISQGIQNQELLGIKNNNKKRIIVAGSTHPGEDEILLSVFSTLSTHHSIHMIIAPRRIERSVELQALADKMRLGVQRRSVTPIFDKDIYILDTIGELNSFYSIADICFVGGSLVSEGGHNPIEPAAQGKPVVFGPYMEDFEEIAEELCSCGGGSIAHNQKELLDIFENLLSKNEFRYQMGFAARACVTEKEGLLNNHIQLIRNFL